MAENGSGPLPPRHGRDTPGHDDRGTTLRRATINACKTAFSYENKATKDSCGHGIASVPDMVFAADAVSRFHGGSASIRRDRGSPEARLGEFCALAGEDRASLR